MPKQINHTAVIEMTKMGYNRNTIADRVKCSERQVRRIVKDFEERTNIKLDADTCVAKGLIEDPEIETILRNVYSKFESPADTANKFGLTRQAIYKGRQN
jgi:DNA invertase Pin-like site-specific DNA recombinase